MDLMNTDRIQENNGIIEIEARARTDFFIDQMNNIDRSNAPFAYKEIEGDFVISALVKPTFHDNYDAGGLFVYDTEQCWIKYEFEKTDLGYKSIVSVITDETSDDCNGEKEDTLEEVYLQIIRRKDYWILHYSNDGSTWKMSRYFKLKMKGRVKAGFESQSPIGNGNKTVFREITIGNKEIKNMRMGK